MLKTNASIVQSCVALRERSDRRVSDDWAERPFAEFILSEVEGFRVTLFFLTTLADHNCPNGVDVPSIIKPPGRMY